MCSGSTDESTSLLRLFGQHYLRYINLPYLHKPLALPSLAFNPSDTSTTTNQAEEAMRGEAEAGATPTQLQHLKQR